MTDDAFVDAFESGTLPPGSFHHRDHVRLTWLYLERYGREQAERRLCEGLRAFAARVGKPGKFDGPLTTGWVEAIDRARAGCRSFEDLVERRPELLDSRFVTVAAPAPDRQA
jgi:hypothetical protein